MSRTAASLAAALLAVTVIVSNASAAVIKTVSGQLVDIDWAGSKIVVSWLSQDDNTFHDVAISVPDGAKLRRGADEINFSELETPSDVTVKYSEDADGNAELITLSVTNPY
jgi:hypothetical protein